MKKIAIITLLLCSIYSFAQVKPVKKPSPISQKTLYINKAKTWFKNEYVESYFKDPYSYRLMKIELFPISLKQKINSLINTLQPELEDLDTSNVYSKYRQKLDTYKFHVNRELILGHDTSIAFYNSELKDRKHEVDVELEKFVSLKSSIETAEKKINGMSRTDQQAIVEYVVYLDCYGRNGYGNLVLNKYTFTLDINGIGRDVKSLNEEE